MDSHLSWAKFELSAIKERVYKQTNRVKNYGISVLSSLGCKFKNNEVTRKAKLLQVVDFFQPNAYRLAEPFKIGSFRILRSVRSRKKRENQDESKTFWPAWTTSPMFCMGEVTTRVRDVRIFNKTADFTDLRHSKSEQRSDGEK
jgi:hypothetical protein